MTHAEEDGPVACGGAPLLSRSNEGRGRPAPVRLVHLGLGNFFRAHQAWYTDRAPDAGDWGYVAFTGRQQELANDLDSQDGLYTLITRAAESPMYEVVGSLTRACSGTDQPSWRAWVAAPATSAITITVTEAAYRRGPDGGVLREDPAVQADVLALRHNRLADVTTVAARLVSAFAARRQADSGPIAIIPCDNLPANGAAVREVLLSTADMVAADLRDWIAESVAFVSTMVDRITPRTTSADVAEVLGATGRRDLRPVVTEPFSEWVLAGSFPAGRPQWELAGAQFVDDVAPFEQRKLWLLNGAHSLLAYVGSIAGHATIAEAMADDRCRDLVEQWWSEATVHLPLPAADVARYTQALTTRFENPAMRHLLAQIAADGSQKLPIRVLPVVRAERRAGRLPRGAICTLAAWIAHLRGHGAPVVDPEATRMLRLASGSLRDSVVNILDYLDPAMASDSDLVAAVADSVHELTVT